MSRTIPIFFLSIATVAFAHSSPAAEEPLGRKLVEAECTYCHGDEVYTAADRKVDEIEKLQDKVDMCMEPAGVEWDEAQQADVVEYLNRQFYRFK